MKLIGGLKGRGEKGFRCIGESREGEKGSSKKMDQASPIKGGRIERGKSSGRN